MLFIRQLIFMCWRVAILGVLRQALVSVLRRRGATLSSTIGVLLAISFISGTFIAFDSSARATLEAHIDGVGGDFSFRAGPGDYTEIRDVVSSVPGVTEVSMTLDHGVERDMGSAFVSFRRKARILGIDPDHPPAIIRNADVIGSLDLPRGSVGIPEELAAALRVTLGGLVYFERVERNETTNTTETYRLDLTVGAILGLERPFNPDPFRSVLAYERTSVFHILDTVWVWEQLGFSAEDYELWGQVWIDRGQFLDPYDLDATQARLGRLERQISEAVLPYRSEFDVGSDVVRNNLRERVHSAWQALIQQRFLFLFLSIPVILLGLYLAALGIELGHAQKQRDLALLKTRGATSKHLVTILLLGAIVGGTVAALFGLLLALGVTGLLIGLVSSGVPTATVGVGDVVVSPLTIAATVVLGILLMGLMSYRSAKRISEMPAIETLRRHSPFVARLDYSPVFDLLLLGIGLALYSAVLYSQYSAGGLPIFLAGVIVHALIPFLPIFLIVGATRLATRASGRIYAWVSHAVRPMVKSLHPILRRNLVRNSRRASSVAVIIALGVAFGLFTLSVFGTLQLNQERTTRALIGADASLSAPVPETEFAADLITISGVREVTRTLRFIGHPSSLAEIYALEPNTYFSVTRPEPWELGTLGADEAFQALSSPGTVLISERYAEAAFLEMGDRLVVANRLYNESRDEFDPVELEVRVGGVVRGLAPLEPWDLNHIIAIYGSFETFNTFIDDRGRLQGLYIRDADYFVDLEPGADWKQVRNEFFKLGATNVRFYEEEVQRSASNPLTQSMLGFVRVQLAFLAVILTAGLALILYAASLERGVEFAAIFARGSSRRQTMGLLLGEAISIMIIGIIFGVAIGYLISYSTVPALVFPQVGFVQERLIPFAFSMPVEAVLLVFLVLLTTVAATLAISWYLARTNVARVLRLRGG